MIVSYLFIFENSWDVLKSPKKKNSWDILRHQCQCFRTTLIIRQPNFSQMCSVCYRNQYQYECCFLPLGGAAGRRGSTVAWWTLSPLRLQKPQLLSSGHGHLLSLRPPTQIAFDPGCCLSGLSAKRPEGLGAHRHSAMPEYGSERLAQISIRTLSYWFKWSFINLFWTR